MKQGAENPKINKEHQQNKGLPLIPLRYLIMLLAVLVIYLFSKSALGPPAMTQASDLTTQNILTTVNEQRTTRNLLALNTNAILSAASQNKTDDMIERHYFSHVDPDGNYIWTAIVAQGYTPYLQLGENIAIEFYDTQSLVSAWMNSPTHRANILNDGFKDQGMGIAFGNTQIGQYHSAIDNTFGTLLASKPKNTPPPAPIPTVSGATQTSNQNVPKQTAQPSKPAPAPEPTPPPPAALSNPEPQPIALRGSENLPAFTLPQTKTTTPASATPATASPATMPAALSPAAIGQPANANPYQVNRNFLLIFGGVLFIILISDVVSLIKERLAPLDKKINNLIVLILSLVVLAIMYWL